MQELIIESLPSLYQKLLPAFFSNKIPSETKATCATCPMTKSQAEAMAKIPLQGFHAITKCCSYQPGHVNYLVGGLLSDTDSALAEGQRRMKERIDKKLGEPFGVSAPPELKLMYEQAQSAPPDQRAKLVCGFYDAKSGGTCTIWRHREAVCSTFFCKHVRGADGRSFWMSIKEYLELVEDQLSRYATYRIAPELFHRADARLQDEDAVPGENYDEIWGSFVGQEVEFYKKCYQLVSAMTPAELETVLGFNGMVELDQVIEFYSKLSTSVLPKRLRLSPATETIPIDAGSIGIMGYCKSDAVSLPIETVNVLNKFSLKEDLADIRLRVAKSDGVELSDELLRELVRHRILVRE